MTAGSARLERSAEAVAQMNWSRPDDAVRHCREVTFNGLYPKDLPLCPIERAMVERHHTACASMRRQRSSRRPSRGSLGPRCGRGWCAVRRRSSKPTSTACAPRGQKGADLFCRGSMWVAENAPQFRVVLSIERSSAAAGARILELSFRSIVTQSSLTVSS